MFDLINCFAYSWVPKFVNAKPLLLQQVVVFYLNKIRMYSGE
ncbi:hypothetical protein J473_4102, partial [Acinetobacter baumannii 1042969-1265]